MRIETTSETGMGDEKAQVLVYDDANKLVATVTANLVRKQGMDGGWYSRIELTSV